MQIDRRALLKGAGQLALVAGFAPQRLLAAPLGANPFTLGVAAGDPWPDGFVIWTRLAPRPLEANGGMPHVAVPVGWEVSEDERFSRVVRKGEALARPELGHSVHVELGGLQPHRHYWYRFTVAGSDVSPVGMARTAPAAGMLVDRARIAVAGCQHWEAGFFDAWGHLAREADLDLVFHYGDYIYEGAARPLGGAIVRQHVGGEIYSIDDYRRRHALYKTDPHLQAAHASCAFAVSFDDHESGCCACMCWTPARTARTSPAMTARSSPAPSRRMSRPPCWARRRRPGSTKGSAAARPGTSSPSRC